MGGLCLVRTYRPKRVEASTMKMFFSWIHCCGPHWLVCPQSQDKGKPANLAEIPDISGSRSSTTASSDLGCSDISSVSSTMSLKLARIASQLEALKLAKASKALEVHETIVVPDDDPNSPDSGSKGANENSLPRLPPRIRIAEILRNAKMRRLANEVKTTDDSHAKTNAPKDEVVPDFVPCPC